VKLPATEGPRRDTRTGVNNLSDQQKVRKLGCAKPGTELEGSSRRAEEVL
jgi:hypothetical protein